MKSFKGTASLILALIMVFACSASALAAIPGKTVSNTLQAEVTVQNPTVEILFTGGVASGELAATATALGITATVQNGTADAHKVVRFTGNLSPAQLETLYGGVIDDTWAAAGFHMYVSIPEGATTLDLTNEVITIGEGGLRGGIININGKQYIDFYAQFAHRNLTESFWQVTHGRLRHPEYVDMATYEMHFKDASGAEIVGTELHFVYDDLQTLGAQLSWVNDAGLVTPGADNKINVTTGKTVKVGVKLDNKGEAADGMLVVLTIKDANGNDVTSGVTMKSNGVNVGSGQGYYYWGPSTGFSTAINYSATTVFDVTFANPGVYDIEIFVVNLNVN